MLYGRFLLTLISLNFNLAKSLIQFLPKDITQELFLFHSILCGTDTAILQTNPQMQTCSRYVRTAAGRFSKTKPIQKPEP